MMMVIDYVYVDYVYVVYQQEEGGGLLFGCTSRRYIMHF
jgi:hypothetical protein